MFIPFDALKAASFFVPDMDIRYYLVGIHVRKGRIEATNGISLFIHKMPHIDPPENVIIPLETVKLALKTKCKGFNIKKDEGAYSLTCVNNESETAQIIYFNPVEGIFPDTSSVIPGSFSGEAANFDYELLGDVRSAARALGDKLMPSAAFNGRGASMFYFNENAFALVMPLRDRTCSEDQQKSILWATE
jgi:DNA polymerase III sliding clamp (beta) subunit (PCNA family)